MGFFEKLKGFVKETVELNKGKGREFTERMNSNMEVANKRKDTERRCRSCSNYTKCGDLYRENCSAYKPTHR